MLLGRSHRQAAKERKKVANVAPIKRTIRARKFDEDKKAAYIELILGGKGRMMAAREVGINVRTVERHMKSSHKFRKAVSQSETEVNQKVENALYEAATSGNVTAIQVWLYNRDPKRWTNRRSVRLAGEGGGPIEVKEIDAKSKLISMLNRLSERSKEDKEECQSQ